MDGRNKQWTKDIEGNGPQRATGSLLDILVRKQRND